MAISSTAPPSKMTPAARKVASWRMVQVFQWMTFWALTIGVTPLFMRHLFGDA
jgi:hypothetical protein